MPFDDHDNNCGCLRCAHHDMEPGIQRRIAEAVQVEREACAKICDEHRLRYPRECGWDDINGAHRAAAYAIGNAIRARGDVKKWLHASDA